MRKAFIVAALAALVATPALAKAPRHMHDAAVSLPRSDEPASDLAIRGGKVMGKDADARVRFELQRDNPFY